MHENWRMTESDKFTAREQIAAECVAELAAVHVFQYAKPEDREAAQVAVLMLAIEILTKKECNEIQ